ncbi:MAG TPA: sulfur oxidation c-type cytochrome SoxX [Thiobacillaceae bacterium]|nr:sulfur oxidation c-type cytochrome SoxX [Thiobacillaceae bacterium]HNU63067.1 sulfur oxidation c-type cytochrome SoxX [Thiobacillaceae bacterium]
MFKKNLVAASILAATSLLLTGGCAATNTGKVDYSKMTPEALAEYLTLESGSFDLDQPTQEGTTARSRVVQDDLQKACSLKKGQELDDQTRAKIMADAAASIKYPAGGFKLGDWKRGRELAWSGFGFRLGNNPDNHKTREVGANCYNCHQIATDRTGGTLGTVLTGYGKLRGNSEDMLKYTYEVIYNPHTYYACTIMPRSGTKNILSQKDILDIMAYLFDPNSPVNK